MSHDTFVQSLIWMTELKVSRFVYEEKTLQCKINYVYAATGCGDMHDDV